MPLLRSAAWRSSRGVELQLTASFADGLDVTAAYTFNDVEVTKANPDGSGLSTLGKRPPLAPEHLVSVWTDYTIGYGAFKGLSVGAGVRYVGSTFADPQNTIKNEPYLLADAGLRYDLGAKTAKLKGAELALNVTNLFNKQYQVCFTAFDCNWGASRMITGRLTYRW